MIGYTAKIQKEFKEKLEKVKLDYKLKYDLALKNHDNEKSQIENTYKARMSKKLNDIKVRHNEDMANMIDNHKESIKRSKEL